MRKNVVPLMLMGGAPFIVVHNVLTDLGGLNAALDSCS
jgi:hypothetical protein